LLVAREIRYGHTSFQDIAMSTGAPRDVLTAWLRKLEQAGVIERRQYSQRPPRQEYLMADAGQTLRPILLALKNGAIDTSTPEPSRSSSNTPAAPSSN
jgi:DNA-binding HxlR family transcriptional regulator